ncbi:uncharacterized protein LOC114515562 [Dendronephthya gigantea]|uniref:uncharacterized protein LOC114515562 n=1 Tax=Dendronephthya gigantea TaxID=151771 RepID=UPI0010697C93|nr:uncharacterized protein LOC114515562 [Dendronephthya gigantea]
MPPRKAKKSEAKKLVSVSRFRCLRVTKRISIREFFKANDLEFATGKGFYQLTKPETIQGNKEIIVRRKSDGKIVTGDEVRDVLDIPKATAKFKLDREKLQDFDVFVQSTSYNRILVQDSDFLYDTGESDAKDGAGTPSTSTDTGAKEKTKPVKRGRTAKGGGKAEEKSDTEKVDEAKEDEAEPSPSKKPRPATVTNPTETSGVKEIVFSFDTTGSMYPCLTQVRRKVAETIKRVFQDIPNIRVAVFAHGDYQDKESTYDTKWVDFTTDENKLCTFVKDVSATCGYDFEECYELVLRQVRTELSWSPNSQRALVMIGDAPPHGPAYHLNTLKINWKDEAKTLYEDMNVHIYAVQALGNASSTSFYSGLAKITSGWHLKLDQFASIVDFLTAICYREQSIEQLQAFEEEVKRRGKGAGMNRSLHALFDTLAGREVSTYKEAVSCDLVPISPSRFQILDVDERIDIKTFVQRNSLLFRTGRGFYEFTKAEKISDKKEVVLVDKVSGDMYTGPEACRMIGAGGTGKIKPTDLEKWRVFVQSTSYNRVLMPDTGFLYEVDPDH